MVLSTAFAHHVILASIPPCPPLCKMLRLMLWMHTWFTVHEKMKILREVEQKGNHTMIKKFEVSKSFNCYKTAVTCNNEVFVNKEENFQEQKKVFFIFK